MRSIAFQSKELVEQAGIALNIYSLDRSWLGKIVMIPV
jgi:hypothetical protein